MRILLCWLFSCLFLSFISSSSFQIPRGTLHVNFSRSIKGKARSGQQQFPKSHCIGFLGLPWQTAKKWVEWGEHWGVEVRGGGRLKVPEMYPLTTLRPEVWNWDVSSIGFFWSPEEEYAPCRLPTSGGCQQYQFSLAHGSILPISTSNFTRPSSQDISEGPLFSRDTSHHLSDLVRYTFVLTTFQRPYVQIMSHSETPGGHEFCKHTIQPTHYSNQTESLLLVELPRAGTMWRTTEKIGTII